MIVNSASATTRPPILRTPTYSQLNQLLSAAMDLRMTQEDDSNRSLASNPSERGFSLHNKRREPLDVAVHRLQELPACVVRRVDYGLDARCGIRS
jgi:hypothetical protein